MQVNSQLHAPPTLTPGKEPPEPTGQEAALITELIGMLSRENFLPPPKIKPQLLDHLSHDLVVISTALPHHCK
jgi:hypothetical protein